MHTYTYTLVVVGKTMLQKCTGETHTLTHRHKDMVCIQSVTAAQQARGDRKSVCVCVSFQNAPTSISSLLSLAIILHFAPQHTFRHTITKRLARTHTRTHTHKHTHNLCPIAGAKTVSAAIQSGHEMTSIKPE